MEPSSIRQQHLAARSTTTRLEENHRLTSSEAEQVRLRDRILTSDSTDVSALQADGANHRQQTTMVDGRQRPVQQVSVRIQKQTKLSGPHRAPCRRSSRSHQQRAVHAVRHDRPRESVRPRLVLYKMDQLGLRGNVLKFVEDFLKDRSIQVRVEAAMSSTYILENGTSQGSVLSPLLFIIMINDLPESSNVVKLVLFAHDSSMWKCGLSVSALSID